MRNRWLVDVDSSLLDSDEDTPYVVISLPTNVPEPPVSNHFPHGFHVCLFVFSNVFLIKTFHISTAPLLNFDLLYQLSISYSTIELYKETKMTVGVL